MTYYFLVAYDWNLYSIFFVIIWKLKVKTAMLRYWEDDDLDIAIERHRDFNVSDTLYVMKSELDDRIKLGRKIDEFL